MYCTPVETPKAKKIHICQSCGERIEAGNVYYRWRCYDSGDAGSIKMHPECYNMHAQDSKREGGGSWEFTPFSHERPTEI